MLRIALTGGIACGKSLVGSVLSGMGIAVCEADAVAHACMEPGQPAYQDIVNTFGHDIIDPAGRINRVALGKLVFEEATQREKLNAIVHPCVRERCEAWLRTRPAECPAAVVIIPLLFEAGLESGWDWIVAVMSHEAAQLERLTGRGLSLEAARQRLAAQLPNEEKARRADAVIENNGTKHELIKETHAVFERILGS